MHGEPIDRIDLQIMPFSKCWFHIRYSFCVQREKRCRHKKKKFIHCNLDGLIVDFRRKYTKNHRNTGGISITDCANSNVF